ncbi:MAG TPA: 5-(carboxyamino)imidazole ribonucleotide synthase [Xanthobacteraceae bacterium]|nr:5-(carboxyamino)imidazole ribonucleotide synthase [Xanthobacteraceae bacterium]
MADQLPVLKPGSTLGILGGGQLGRMLIMAAARLGLRCHVYSPEPDSCAFDVAAEKTCAAYDDDNALTRFANSVDLITYEFENVPAETADFLVTNRNAVLPDPAILATTQDRLAEKNFLIDFGIGTAPFAEIGSEVDIAVAIVQIPPPAVLKTRRLGYDGKGQAVVHSDSDTAASWKGLGEVPAILEGFIKFEREFSVVAARGRDGSFAAYDPIENVHRDHILHQSLVPAALTPALAKEAVAITKKIADELAYVGVLAVEMFVVAKDGKRQLLVNEIAPRVHNSGHWTIDGASASQFEQHIRAIAGWPLAQPRRLGKVEMTNLIGEEIENWKKLLAEPGAALHIYGKREARPGRKMGHVTRVKPEK